MKLEWKGIVQSVVVALLVSLVVAAFQTYVEVKMLRHDVQRLEEVIDNLVDEATKKP